jgi:hypothetical protein
MIKTIRCCIVLVVVIAVTSTPPVVAAEDSVHFNAPINFAGTGCPAGTMDPTVEGTTLSILFDSYDAANPPVNSISGLKRSACSFAVPVHVPAGWQVSLLTADWRGFAEGETDFQREYFFADQTGGIKIITRFYDPYNNGIDYTEQDSLEPGDYTACQSQDRDVILRINSSIQAKSTDGYIAVDTVDMDNKVVFKLNSKTCHGGWLPFIPLLLLKDS